MCKSLCLTFPHSTTSILERIKIENERKKLINSFAFQILLWGFPGGAVVESLPANAGDTGSSPGLGRSHMPRSN